MDSLERLVERIGEHQALNNPFYDAWINRGLDIEALRIFARNYGEWVKSFPATLAILFLKTDDLQAQTEYVKTLFSEMGYGKPDQVHSRLLDTFFSELATKLGYEGALDRDRIKGMPLLPTTEELIKGERRLYGSRSRELAVGAQLALEWQAYTMLRKLFEGALRYKSLWQNLDQFHEACEYFYDHLGDVEKEHKRQSLIAAKRYTVDGKSLQRIIDGYNRHLDLIANFWNGLHKGITSR